MPIIEWDETRSAGFRRAHRQGGQECRHILPEGGPEGEGGEDNPGYGRLQGFREGAQGFHQHRFGPEAEGCLELLPPRGAEVHDGLANRADGVGEHVLWGRGGKRRQDGEANPVVASVSGMMPAPSLEDAIFCQALIMPGEDVVTGCGHSGHSSPSYVSPYATKRGELASRGSAVRPTLQSDSSLPVTGSLGSGTESSSGMTVACAEQEELRMARVPSSSAGASELSPRTMERDEAPSTSLRRRRSSRKRGNISPHRPGIRPSRSWTDRIP